MADGSKTSALLGTAAGSEQDHTEPKQLAGRGGSHGDACDRAMRVRGSGQPWTVQGGGPGRLGAQANDGRELTQPVTLPATSVPSLRIVASDNKVPIGRDALPLEGRAVG